MYRNFTVRAILLFFFIYFLCSISTFKVLLLSDPMFPFSYHSFQTDPQAQYSRKCWTIAFLKFLNFWWILAKSPPFWEKYDRTLIWKVRMVRSLADRTFQLSQIPSRAPRGLCWAQTWHSSPAVAGSRRSGQTRAQEILARRAAGSPLRSEVNHSE